MADKNLIALRHALHRFPEVSNREFETSEKISSYMRTLQPDEIISLGRTGKVFIFNGNKPGLHIMFRAELDGLPITENSGVPYQSTKEGCSHACGHDGHMTILAGLATRIAGDRPERGKVSVIFQPAEEVEQGARDVVEDPAFKTIEPDYIFALHNIPGAEKHSILVKPGAFASASRGMTVKLSGRSSHAAEPENGINPAMAISRIIAEINRLSGRNDLYSQGFLATIIHVKLGEISFGTSPGYGEVRITLRATDDENMETVMGRSEELIKNIAESENVRFEISYGELFPATINDPECTQMVEIAARSGNMKLEFLKHPFKWSEDFGYYTGHIKGCLFGIGAGREHPALHNPDYDFPDEILDTGIELFYRIYKQIMSDHA